MSDPAPSRTDDAGIVLVTVLWLLVLLGGLAMAMSMFTTSALTAIDIYNDHPRGEAAVLAGLDRAAAEMLAVDPPVPTSGSLTVGGARIRYAGISEAARIDVNFAPLDLLSGLFASLGASPNDAAAYAGAIVALRGERPTKAVPGQPAGFDPDEETPAHIAALTATARTPPGQPDPHRPFVDAIQLTRLPGLPMGLMARALPYLTTYSGVAGIDPHVATPEVIAALPGMTRERLRTVLGVRGPGADPVALSDALGDSKRFTVDRPVPTTRIRVRAVLPDGFTSVGEIVVVHYPDDREPFRVLSWDDDGDMRGAPVKDAFP